MKVELVYERTCPNIQAARLQLLRAFATVGATTRWQEWEVSSPDAPPHVHGYGSPTILVDGRDVSGSVADADDYCCRVYAHGDPENKGVPALADIVRALKGDRQDVSPGEGGARWRQNAAIVPAVGVSLLPKLVCPACWPAYAGFLSSLGVGFVNYTAYLLPLTAVFLIISLVTLAFRAKRRRGYKPLLLGAVAAGTLLIGKFRYDSDLTMYVGLGLLVAASMWNTWPRAKGGELSCPACATAVREE